MSAAICEGLRPEQGEGIGSIIELSSSTRGARNSLGRTSSADLSSKKWLSHHLPLEKIKEFSTTAESPASAAAEGSNKELERQGQFDIWSAIQSQKAIDSNSSAPTAYVHPLVKRSASLLSEKSLQICTESLGSESGSDGSSSSDELDHSPIQRSEDEEENGEDTESQDSKKGLGAENQNCSITQKLLARSFPPPLPSLSRCHGPCLHMRPHRKNDRLVLEAVPVPSYNNFHAQRQGGRLLLTCVNTTTPEEKQEIKENNDDNEEEAEFAEQDSKLELEKVENEIELNPEEEEEEEVEEEATNVVIQKGKFVLSVHVTPDDGSNGVMMVHRLALVLSKTVGSEPLKNHNPWDDHEMSRGKRDECKVLVPFKFNAYEFCWRSSEPLFHLPSKSLLLKAQNFLFVRRCKEEPCKPLLIWNPPVRDMS